MAVGPIDDSLRHMIRYHLGWEDARGQAITARAGKRTRPVLCLLACEAAGGDWRHALPAAVAIELLHNFTLIHDDIQDSSTERRGRRTVWAVWGVPLAVNVGDALHVISHRCLLELGQTADPATVVEAIRLLDDTSLTLCQGQQIDMEAEGRLDVDQDRYLFMIQAKTAALIRCALELGAIVAGADGATRTRLGDFGEAVGLSFQVRDDILGIWGDESVTGKSAASDILSRKKSWPIVHALGAANSDDRGTLLALYGRDLRPADVPTVLSILERAGSRAAAEQQAARFHRQALQALDQLPADRPAVRMLHALAEQLLGRQA